MLAAQIGNGNAGLVLLQDADDLIFGEPAELYLWSSRLGKSLPQTGLGGGGNVMTVGARVAWDNTAKEVTTPAAGRFPIGVAVEATGNGVTSVAVRLDGIATAAA